MTRFAQFQTFIAVAATAVLFASPASAASVTTWVSGSGVAEGECTRAAPCTTYAKAYESTGDGGQIRCLDAGEFGTLEINRSVSIICDRNDGIVDASSATGFLINAPAGSVIVLAGQTIDCLGANRSGIEMIGAGVILRIRDVEIKNCPKVSSGGIGVLPTSGSTELYLADSIVTNSGVGLRGRASASGASIQVHVERTLFASGEAGVRMQALGGGSKVRGLIRDSAFVGNEIGFHALSHTSAVTFVLSNVTASGNSYGLMAGGQLVTVVVDSSQITANEEALATSNNGKIFSHRNNDLYGNDNNGAFTSPAVPLK